MTGQEKKNIYNAIQNLYNMDFTTWQEVLAMLYNLVADVEQKFEKLETRFTLLLGKEVTEAIKKMHESGELAEIINQEIFSNLNNKIDEIRDSILNTLNGEIDRLDKEIEKVNEQLEHKANTNKIVQIIGYEFLEMKGQDISDLLQYYVDNNYSITLPDSYNFTCSKPIIINKKTVIHGNNSLIKFTYDGERGLFEQNNNGASLECYDLIVEISNNQIAYDFRLANRDSGTHVRLYNCVVTGNKGNTKGVIMTQNDFSCIKDTKFWSIAYPIKVTSTQRSNTQILFENVGIVDCVTGVELESCDKISLINVDIATCDFGFKIENGNRRLKFLNCHVESFTDTGYALTDNVQNDDIIFENCSVLVATPTTKQGFYCGCSATYRTSGLKFINCGGDLGGIKIFNIKSPVYFYGRLNTNDSFIAWEDTYINTNLVLDEEQVVYIQKEYAPSAESFAGTVSFTENDNFNNFNFNGDIYINHTFNEEGYYEITYNGYNGGSDEIFLSLQQNGGTWTKPFSNIRLNKEKIKQRLVFYIENPASYRIMFTSYAPSDLKLRNIVIKNIKV